MGDFETREEAERALDFMGEAEPGAADEFAVFELDESGKLVGESITRSWAPTREVRLGWRRLVESGRPHLPPARLPAARRIIDRSTRTSWPAGLFPLAGTDLETASSHRSRPAVRFPVVGRNVLVVTTVEDADDVLRAHVGEADTIKVVVPVVRQSFLDWLANDEKAFTHAEQVAERTARELSGETVDAVAGEADVNLAIRDALATFAADEIVVAVRPAEEQGLVESMATDTAPHHRLEGIPVRYVVIG